MGHDSSSGVKEGGTGLLDLDFGDRMHIFINAKKKSTKIHKMLKLAYVKKKTEIDRKKNHTWCELGHDSSSGVKEGGTGLLDLNSGGSVC